MSASTDTPDSTDVPAATSRATLGAMAETIGGPPVTELEEIRMSIARSWSTHDMPPGALSALLGGLLSVAAGPFGQASTIAIHSLRNAHKAVNHR